MLNLVQLQERLKGVPMQALMQYANGSNPQVPPFLALGELNRRKKMQESAAAEQAQEMEGAPTIKDQIEQSTGLLALQGSRQRQAAQQQQGIQAAMPMAAPNTTTSEPAQMAGGGFIDDVVVPRDYQMGGQVGQQMNPEMLKKLMMLKAMKQRQGVSGLPVGNMFKRSDYAGGGIVAFNGLEGSQVDPIFSGDGAGESTTPSSPNYARPSQLTATKEQIAMMSLAELQEYYRSGKIPDRLRIIPQQAKPPAAVPQPKAPGSKEDRTKEEEASDAVKGFIGINPATAFTAPIRQTPEQFKQKLTEQNKIFGVSEDPYADLKKRYGDIEAEDVKARAEQPMDRLMEFLSGVTEGRGGNWATQGARGAKAAMALEAQQKALNRKQSLDMAALRTAITEREDARARGDRDRFITHDKEVEAATLALEKDRLALRQSQAQIQNQAKTAQAALMQAGKSGFPEERRALMIQQAVQKRLDANPRVKLLEISTKPEDRAELESIKKKALADAIAEVQAIMNSMQGLGSLEGIPTGGQRIRYDAQGNPIQ